MSDAEGEAAEVVEAAPEPEPSVVQDKASEKRKEHGLVREEQQNVVVQPLLTGKTFSSNRYNEAS